jgi:hypothetical protein
MGYTKTNPNTKRNMFLSIPKEHQTGNESTDKAAMAPGPHKQKRKKKSHESVAPDSDTSRSLGFRLDSR